MARRGRRPAGQDARGAILEAARMEFAEQGYDGASMRSVARRAGVDPGTVRHWFPEKSALLPAALGLAEVSPHEIVKQVVDGPLDRLGERLVRVALKVWDDAGPDLMRVALPAVLGSPELRSLMPQFLLAEVLGPIARNLPSEDAALRTSLLGSQMIGLAMARYVVGLEPIASLPADGVVAAVAPNLQRYLTGKL
ncbi:TetR family transcriptional regulator [Myceligenerans crystallogenes]|uniref:TetR family transcriptional regulator n=1 Tax=Myceligenerans crystallogenes TaxID=316335 RepID=A0ABN2N3L0_9MICO